MSLAGIDESQQPKSVQVMSFRPANMLPEQNLHCPLPTSYQDWKLKVPKMSVHHLLDKKKAQCDGFVNVVIVHS